MQMPVTDEEIISRFPVGYYRFTRMSRSTSR